MRTSKKPIEVLKKQKSENGGFKVVDWSPEKAKKPK
jgi:hypothetical protein